MFWPEKCSLWIRVRYSGSNSFKIWVVHRVCGYHYGTRIVVALKKVMASVLGLFADTAESVRKYSVLWGGKKKVVILLGFSSPDLSGCLYTGSVLPLTLTRMQVAILPCILFHTLEVRMREGLSSFLSGNIQAS